MQTRYGKLTRKGFHGSGYAHNAGALSTAIGHHAVQFYAGGYYGPRVVVIQHGLNGPVQLVVGKGKQAVASSHPAGTCTQTLVELHTSGGMG